MVDNCSVSGLEPDVRHERSRMMDVRDSLGRFRCLQLFCPQS